MDAIDKINAILKERGMSGAELSRRIGVSTAVYSQWNKKKTSPSNRSLLKISKVFEIPVSELTDEPKKEKPSAKSGGPPGYEKLNCENRAFVDGLIEKLLKSQSAG